MEEPEFRYTIWTTAKGKTMRLKELDDKHLFNCIKMVERKLRRAYGHIPTKPYQPRIYINLQKEQDYRKKMQCESFAIISNNYNI